MSDPLTNLELLITGHSARQSETPEPAHWYDTVGKESVHRYSLDIPLSIWNALKAQVEAGKIRRFIVSAVRYKLANPDPVAVLDAARELLPLLERLRPHILDAAHGDIAQEEYDAFLEAIRELLKT